MIPHGVEVFVGLDPIDLRWSFDRLAGVVAEESTCRRRKGRCWCRRPIDRSITAATSDLAMYATAAATRINELEATLAVERSARAAEQAAAREWVAKLTA